MGWAKTKVKTTKPLTDIHGNIIPKGTDLIFFSHKNGNAVFRSAESGRQFILEWKNVSIDDFNRTMKVCEEKLIRF